MPMPDFLLVGAPKSGTTALHVALSRHPQLCLSSPKEPKYFLTDGPPPTGGGPGDAKTYQEYVWRREDYEALWSHAEPGQLRGESTTLYLADPDAHRRIRAQVPDAKLVAVLRDPVDRAHSNWSHLRSAGLEPACAVSPAPSRAGVRSGATCRSAVTASSSSTCTPSSPGNRSSSCSTGTSARSRPRPSTGSASSSASRPGWSTRCRPRTSRR